MTQEVNDFNSIKESLTKKGKEKGYLTFDELSERLKGIDLDSDSLENLYNTFIENGIELRNEEINNTIIKVYDTSENLETYEKNNDSQEAIDEFDEFLMDESAKVFDMSSNNSSKVLKHNGKSLEEIEELLLTTGKEKGYLTFNDIDHELREKTELELVEVYDFLFQKGIKFISSYAEQKKDILSFKTKNRVSSLYIVESSLKSISKRYEGCVSVEDVVDKLRMYGISKESIDEVFETLRENSIKINDVPQILESRRRIERYLNKKKKQTDNQINYVDYSDLVKKYLLERTINDQNEFEKNEKELKNVLLSSQNKEFIDNESSIPKMPKLSEELSKIPEENNHLNIVLKRLTGKDLDGIGRDYNISGTTIRKIINEEFDNIQETIEENKYKDLFQNYDFDCNVFCKLYNENEIVYYFLKEKYKKGNKRPYELLKENILNDEQRKKLKQIYNIIEYNNEDIEVNKNELLIAILKKYGKSLEYSEIISEYNKIVTDNNLKLDLLTSLDIRNVDGIYNRATSVICGSSGHYRYYSLENFDKKYESELKKMLDVSSGAYSTEYFYNNNQYLMKSLDIENEYELHNFLKKNIGDFNGKIVYSRMPDIMIDCKDKVLFIKKLIQKLSPISVESFIEYVYENYGHKPTSLKPLITSNFGMYINNGILIAKTSKIDDTKFKILKNRLTCDIYSVSTVKDILRELFDDSNMKILDNQTITKLGYKLNGNFILKKEFKTLESYMLQIISNSDYYIVDEEMKKIGPQFTRELQEFINYHNLFKIEEDKYITYSKMDKMGVHVGEFYKRLAANNKIPILEYFNLYSLKLDDKFKTLNGNIFPDVFYESLISTIDNIKTLKIKGNYVFMATDETITIEKFIKSFVSDNNDFPSQIREQIKKQFDIDIDEKEIKKYISK